MFFESLFKRGPVTVPKKEPGIRTEQKKSPEQKRLCEIKESLLSRLEASDVETGERLLREDFRSLTQQKEQHAEAFKKTEEWLSQNNNRINLYFLAGQQNDGWKLDDAFDDQAKEQLLTYRRIEGSLLRLAELGGPEAAKSLQSFFQQAKGNERIAKASIDALATVSSPEVPELLTTIIKDEGLPFALRTRALLSGLRNRVSGTEKQFSLLQKHLESLGDNLHQDSETFALIEAAGLAGGGEGMGLLANINDRLRTKPFEQRRWFIRDLLSTALTIDPEHTRPLLEEHLGSRFFQTEKGTVVGSLNPQWDFARFAQKEERKLRRIATAVESVNEGFATEPVRFIDITPERLDGAGWTQNAVYDSAFAIQHVKNPEDLAQSAGHEASERWQTKGFIDAKLSRLYLALMGDTYEGSLLDKLRLKWRETASTRSGHPWDGEREFIAELGSTAFVDPSQINRLFSPEDVQARAALAHMKDKIALQQAKTAAKNGTHTRS